MVEAKDAENAVLRAEPEASLERERRLELRLAELERRLSMDSSDSGTPSSKERIGAKEARRARQQQSERERRQDRKRGGQPGHKGKGLARDPDPGERKEARRFGGVPQLQSGPGRRSGCGGSQWAQVIDAEIVRTVTQWALPGLVVRVLRDGHVRGPPPGAHAGRFPDGPVLIAAAVLLTAYGNVPPERGAG